MILATANASHYSFMQINQGELHLNCVPFTGKGRKTHVAVHTKTNLTRHANSAAGDFSVRHTDLHLVLVSVGSENAKQIS